MKATAPAILALLLLAACGKSDPEASKKTDGSSTAKATKSSIELPEGEFTYHFGTNPAATNISCSTSTSVIDIQATTHSIEGSATIDFKNGKGSCKVAVPVTTLDTGDVGQTNAMKGPVYLNGKEFPAIEFVSEEAVHKGGRDWEISGKFSLRGVTKDIVVKADVVPVSEKLGTRWGEGKWVRVRTEFPVDMREYGMELTKQYVGDVDPVWKVSIVISGTTVKPAEPISAAPAKDGDGPTIAEIRRMRPKRESKDELSGEVYRIGTPKQLVRIAATSVTEAEVVTATTRTAGGYLGIDREKGTGEVRLNFSVYSLTTGIEKRDDNLVGASWLDGENHSHVFFKAKDIRKKAGEKWVVNGELTLRGVTKPLSAEVMMREHDAERAAKLKWGSKPVLEFRTEFKVKFSDFGITIPEKSKLNVNDELTVQMQVGATKQ